MPHWNAVARTHTTIHDAIVQAMMREMSLGISFGDRLKMFWQAESLAMDRDRMKRISLAYSAFAEDVSHVGVALSI